MSSPRRTPPPTTPTKPLASSLSPTNPATRTLNPALRTLLTTPTAPNIPITPLNPPSTPRNTTTGSARRLINPTTTPPNSLHATRRIHLSAVSTPHQSPRHCNDCGTETHDFRCFTCKLAHEVPGTPTRAGPGINVGHRDAMGGGSRIEEQNMTPMEKLQEARRDFMRNGMRGDGRRRCAVERLGELKIDDVEGQQQRTNEAADDVEMI